jgi:gamma-glutamylcyclotransferase (GGCT)/AIG2-like uncharacterized protein YtfP
MELHMQYNEKLFSYGTLQDEKVQLANFSRRLSGAPDILAGWRLSDLKITDPHVIAVSGKDVHQIVIPTGNIKDEIAGTVFEITSQELEQADAYEVSDYKRICAQLRSGTKAWVYVHKSALSEF